MLFARQSEDYRNAIAGIHREPRASRTYAGNRQFTDTPLNHEAHFKRGYPTTQLCKREEKLTNDLEDRLGYLESELQKKNQIIAELRQFTVASEVFPPYFHEARNALSILTMHMTGLFETCRKKGIRTHINEITQSVETLRDLNESMARLILRPRKEGTVSVEECTRASARILRPMIRGAGILLEMKFGNKAGDLKVPKSEFMQVLINLLLNAIDAVEFQGTPERRSLIQIETVSNGEFTVLTIRDNGHGIDGDVIPRIWEPFFTTRSNRGGLGLTVVKNLVEQLGGQVTVESKLGEFTQFAVILPQKREVLV